MRVSIPKPMQGQPLYRLTWYHTNGENDDQICTADELPYPPPLQGTRRVIPLEAPCECVVIEALHP